MGIKSSIPKVSMRDLGRIATRASMQPPADAPDGEAERELQKELGEHLGGPKLLAQDEAHFSQPKNQDDLLKEWLATEAGFATEFVQIRDNNEDYHPIDMDLYQVELLNCHGKFVYVKKSRRVGISYTTSLRGVIRAHLRSGYDSYYVSRNLEEAKEKIKYALEIYQALPTGIKKKLKGHAVKAQLEFESKGGALSRLISHPQTEPRGRQGDIYLDEFSSYLDQHSVYMAAIACILREGSMWIVSTPRKKGDIFHAIDVAENGEYQAFNGGRFNIPWWHCKAMVKEGFLEEAMELAAAMETTGERVYRYGSDRVIAVYESASSEGDFQVEMECQYADDSTSAIPDKVIFRNVFSGAEGDWGDRFQHRSPAEEKMLRDNISQFFCRDLQGLYEAKDAGVKVGKSFVAGIDPGYTDGCSICIVDETCPTLPVARCLVKLTGVEYAQIEDMVVEMMKRLPIRKLGIDTRGGEGRSLASKLNQILDDGESRVVSFMTDNTILNDMLAEIKRLLEGASLAIPHDDDLIRDLKRVSRTYTEATGKPTVTVQRDRKHGHGDNYFALGYAVLNLRRFDMEDGHYSMPDYGKLKELRRDFPVPTSKLEQAYYEIITGKRAVESRRFDDSDIMLRDAFDLRGLPKP